MDRLTKEQAAIIGCYTGIVRGNTSGIHELAEKLLNRPIQSFEFGGKQLWDELKEKSKPLFLSICYKE